jgi:2-keto-3-deoxy-L-arabinonate dehydratase
VLTDDERDTVMTRRSKHVAGRVPVIVTTTHFSTRSAPSARRAQDKGAAMVMVMPPYHGATFRVGERRSTSSSARLGRDRHPDHDPGRAGGRHAAVAAFLARMAGRSRTSRISRSRRPGRGQAARADRLGGEAIEGPWDGEEAITLMPDLDAGATGAMTGGGYPDGIRQILDPYFAGAATRPCRLRALAAADQLREPPVRP